MCPKLDPDLEEVAIGDPRGRTEEEWLDVFEFLLARLSVTTGATIEVGAYWLDVGTASETASASLGARVRADGPLLGTASDSWEAAFCITGGSDGAHVDLFAFPFLRGSVVTRHGRMADLHGDHDVDELWIHYTGEKWEDRGWHYPEGAGEWGQVLAPGIAFFRHLYCRAAKPVFTVGEPLVITVDHVNSTSSSLGGEASLSIHRLCRDRQRVVDAPSMLCLPRPDTSRRLNAGFTTLPAVFHIESFSIPGGWLPGRYEVELRLNHALHHTSRDSDISSIVEFEVVAR